MDSEHQPETIQQFFDFYYDIFKPLYSHMQIIKKPPLEMFFEMNAALDHLASYWKYGQDEKSAVHAASGHLKRGCFDAFKLFVLEVKAHYDNLCKIDTSIIDNGEFDKGMINLWNEIQTQAVEARKSEGESRDVNVWHKAFDRWYEVYDKCNKFEQKYYLSEKVSWARKIHTKQKWSGRIEGFVIGLLVNFICNPIYKVYEYIIAFF